MLSPITDLENIRKILQTSTSIAMVGLSPNNSRPSFQVADYLLRAGYNVIPVNPGHDEILGRRSFPDLSSIKGQVDIVDIFRRSKDVMPIVKDAIAIKAKVVWMQLGIINREAARLAEESGLTVIMDRCIKIDHHDLLVGRSDNQLKVL